MSMFRTLFPGALRATAPRSLGLSISRRTYAGKKDMSAVQGEQMPGAASNVAESGSVSAQHQELKKSRGMDSDKQADNVSVQTPVSNPHGSQVGQQDDDTSTQQVFKQNPNAPAEEKRKNVEQQGQKALDPADK